MTQSSKQRELIRNMIQKSDRHLSADDIYLQCRENGTPVSIATIYRNLNILCEEGSIRKVSVPGQADHYDRALSPHGHLICSSCGRITDLFFPELQDLLEQKSGSTIDTYELSIRYLCPECRRRQE